LCRGRGFTNKFVELVTDDKHRRADLEKKSKEPLVNFQSSV
jgi:hypothetical protein